MKKLMIINGPNLNLLGLREPDIYGSTTYQDLISGLKNTYPDWVIDCRQSNHEGCIIDYIHDCIELKYEGLVINPAGYSHTSVAILDALKIVTVPKVEVHISDVKTRESFRKVLITAQGCDLMIAGKQIQGYYDAIDYIIRNKG